MKVSMLSLLRYILLLGTITGLLIITAGAGCSDDDEVNNSDSLSISISDVKVSQITETTATISWITDVPATSEVLYDCSTWGGNPDTLLDEEPDTFLDEELVTSHSVTLTELDPDTISYFKVGSRDDADNEAASEQETFTTSAPADTDAPVISEIAVSEITGSGATISWVTNEPATSNLEYGPDTDYGDSFPSTPDTTADKTSHSLTLSGLSPEEEYHFMVKSADDAGNEAVSEDRKFNLSTTPDITAPMISGIYVADITETTATIYWATDEPATSNLEYGLNTGYGYSSPSTPDTTSDSYYHGLTLSSLSPGTTYYYRVKSTDNAGNEAVSVGYHSFTTNFGTIVDTTPPVISSYSASAAGSVATISWVTNEPASSQVVYLCNTWGAVPITLLDGGLVTSHGFTFYVTSGLTYNYTITSRDASGNVATVTGSFFAAY
jgi:hypothetical protein